MPGRARFFDWHAQTSPKKRAALPCIHGDATYLPFRDASCDFASNQFAFHHVVDKTKMLCDVYRIANPDAPIADTFCMLSIVADKT